MSSSLQCVLVVADPGRVSELVSALAEPLAIGATDVLVSSGGDDTIDLFESRAPRVVVLTATLEVGDAKSLIEALREMAGGRDRVVIVLVGDDDTGPIRTALDAIDFKPDRFVSRPLATKALRFAVQSGLEAVARALGEVWPAPTGFSLDQLRTTQPITSRGPAAVAGDGGPAGETPTVTRAPTDRGTGISQLAPASGDVAAVAVSPAIAAGTEASRAALRTRLEQLADSIDLADDDIDIDMMDEDPGGSALPLPPIARAGSAAERSAPAGSADVFEIAPRKKGGTNPEFLAVPPLAPWRPGNTTELREQAELAPAREPTLILHDPPPAAPAPGASAPHSDTAATTGAAAAAADASPRERWSQPVLLSELIDRTRDSSRELLAHVREDLGRAGPLDDDMIVGHRPRTPPPQVARGGRLQSLEDLLEPEPPPEATAPPVVEAPSDRPGTGRDFARQLRAKMSMMAQRLFQSDSPAVQSSVDIRPRHDHHTEIDLASLGEEPVLGGGVTEIEASVRAPQHEPRAISTSPGSWDTQVRERKLPDTGELVRGVSDAAIVLARMFAQSTTGRVVFSKDHVEKVVYFDQGRPVFAASNEQGDRMGELLVREGKITASQYERCQVHVEQSGRRMGEILVDFGYLKRRELLPAVRRHVEDILYSLFGWDHGMYHVTREDAASAERIRLSRHPASLVLEGIRRKLGRSALEKLLGSSSTVIEIPDRERLGSVVNTSDLATEERAALAAFDGNADLAQVARTSGVDVADVLPLAWGLCVLGLAIARRAEPDVLEESTALVGETDLAIDRERVRARWQLVTEADYFALLGVRRDATAFEIRRAYQSARRDFAADCFPTDLRRELARELDEIATVLDEAFRVLRDDRLRLTYLANLFDQA